MASISPWQGLLTTDHDWFRSVTLRRTPTLLPLGEAVIHPLYCPYQRADLIQSYVNGPQYSRVLTLAFRRFVREMLLLGWSIVDCLRPCLLYTSDAADD